MTAAEGARGTCLETSVGRGCESCGPSTILVGWFQDERQGAGRGEGEARSRSLTSFGMTTAGEGGGEHIGIDHQIAPTIFRGSSVRVHYLQERCAAACPQGQRSAAVAFTCAR